MRRQLSLLLGMLLVCWTSCIYADEGLRIEAISETATFPTKVIGSIAAIGDSITAAFNAAHSEFESCEYRDTPAYNFATNKIGNTTVSIAERAIAYKGSGVATANFGQDGARMSHGDDQAQAAKTWLLKQAAPRLVTVFLGHNDICSGTKDKFTSCESANRDPNNYCRTSTFAYEQQMRQMLDVLVTIPDSQILIIHPIRVSQLCNFRDEKVFDTPLISISCGDLWDAPMDIFGQDGVCPSLTDCTVDRIADAYTTWLAYREIANKLINEYNLFIAGDTIPTDSTYGTGNVVRAINVTLLTTDVIGNSKFRYNDAFGNPQLSVCECFHPSKYGQNLLANSLWQGVTCNAKTPCCDDSLGDDFDKGICKNELTGGSMEGPWAGLEVYKTLSIDKTGTGTGTIKSNPAGIDCGSACQESFSMDSTITLVAKPDPGSVFKGWSGSCNGTKKTCTLGMSDNHVVTATFVSGPTIKVAPAQKNYRKVKLTKTKTITFTIKNRISKGKKDLLVGTVTSDSAAFVIVDDFCSNTSVSPKGSCKLKIQFVPLLGLQTATLAIPSNDPDAANTEIPLTGEGVP